MASGGVVLSVERRLNFQVVLQNPPMIRIAWYFCLRLILPQVIRLTWLESGILVSTNGLMFLRREALTPPTDSGTELRIIMTIRAMAWSISATEQNQLQI